MIINCMKLKFLDGLIHSVCIINDELQLQCLFILIMHLQSINIFQQIFESAIKSVGIFHGLICIV